MSCSTSSTPATGISPPPGLYRGGPELVITRRPFLCGSSVLPEDFVERLDRQRRANGRPCNDFCDPLGPDLRRLLRWKQGPEPGGGAMQSLFPLALRMPGRLEILMSEGFGMTFWQEES